MRDRAQAVVIGGGVGGAVLYWLTKLGWSDVVLVERADLTSGSTFHSQFRFTRTREQGRVVRPRHSISMVAEV